ncbi:Lipocalin domain containing protein [Trichuris trichiura]|uniref:Lipocalin domain containing protein n=1 Tax=Trichuris trichiura TaxID=36087 RepID=A0A077YZR9_TRITR|nr:Lipocalin domain containing protein [Trichuris trichiura]
MGKFVELQEDVKKSEKTVVLIVRCIFLKFSHPAMSANLVGRYKLASSENFEAFMKELGVNFMLRKLAHAAVVTVEIIEEKDGFWILKNDSPFRHLQVRFRLGEPVEEITPDGRRVMV